jgi:hypothetical protein
MSWSVFDIDYSDQKWAIRPTIAENINPKGKLIFKRMPEKGGVPKLSLHRRNEIGNFSIQYNHSQEIYLFYIRAIFYFYPNFITKSKQ